MATSVQWRRGTTAQHATFTGALGEVTVDTDKKVLVVHDGATAGGFPVRDTASAIHAAPSKTTPVDADEFGIADSSAAWGLKRLTWANIKTALGTLFFAKTGGTISGDATVMGTLTSGQGQTAQYPPLAFTAVSTGHAISRWAGMGIGMWQLGQDPAGNGVRDFFLYDTAAGAVRLRVDTAGNVTAPSGALGYGLGAGGTVTQNTSKTTGVALNKPSGVIYMHNASLAAGAFVEFTLSNTLLTTADGLVVNPDGFTGYAAEVSHFNSPTEVVIRVTNKGATRSDPVQVKFRIFKGSLT